MGSTQSYPTLSDPMDCSLPGSSVHGIFQARVLEWGAIAFSVLSGQEAANQAFDFLLHGKEMKHVLQYLRVLHLWVTRHQVWVGRWEKVLTKTAVSLAP